jgi:hypothetical protein
MFKTYYYVESDSTYHLVGWLKSLWVLQFVTLVKGI